MGRASSELHMTRAEGSGSIGVRRLALKAMDPARDTFFRLHCVWDDGRIWSSA
jgi:hypothetical protein